MFVNTQTFSFSTVNIGKNKVHVVQTKTCEIQLAIGFPELLQADRCVGSVSCCNTVPILGPLQPPASWFHVVVTKSKFAT